MDLLHLDALARHVLERSGHPEGGRARDIATGLGYTVREVPLPVGVRGISVPGQRVILVSRSRSRQRDEFTIAHEIAELEFGGQETEEACDLCAAAIMLPRDPFVRSLATTGWELLGLQRRWPWASRAVLTIRLLGIIDQSAPSIWETLLGQ